MNTFGRLVIILYTLQHQKNYITFTVLHKVSLQGLCKALKVWKMHNFNRYVFIIRSMFEFENAPLKKKPDFQT